MALCDLGRTGNGAHFHLLLSRGEFQKSHLCRMSISWMSLRSVLKQESPGTRGIQVGLDRSIPLPRPGVKDFARGDTLIRNCNGKRLIPITSDSTSIYSITGSSWRETFT